MAAKSTQTPRPGRWNVLIMRPKGEVTNLSVSPWILILGFLFALVFAAVSVVVINRHFVLVLEHEALAKKYHTTAEALDRLQNLYAYQTMVDDDYARLVSSVIQSDGAGEEDDGANPAGGDFIALGSMERLKPDQPQSAATPVDDEAAQALADWAALFPDPGAQPAQELDVADLRLNGAGFRFQLSNETPGFQARGRLLLLFAVETEDGLILRPYPEFDPASAEPDFAAGPGYNIRSSKPVAGRLKLPPGSRVVEMMAIVRSGDGEIVLKKSLRPEE